MLDLASVVLGLPMLWAFSVMTWWQTAEVRHTWRSKVAAYAAEHGEPHQAPQRPVSRPSLARYLQALTLAVILCPLVAAAGALSGRGLLAAALTSCAVRAARELRANLVGMRDQAAKQVPAP